MGRFRRIEIIEPCSSLLIRETSIFSPKIQRFPYFAEEEMELSFALNFLNPNPFEIFDTITDVTQMEKTHFYLQSLCDRVSALELSFDQLSKPKTKSIDRKYTWTAEIKDGMDRKYKWTAEIKGAENKKKEKRKDMEKEKEKEKAKEKEIEKHKEGRVVKNLKWTTEIKGKGLEAPICKTYTFKASSGNADQGSGSEKKDKKNWKKRENDPRVVEIEETGDHGVLVLRQAFAKRAGAVDNRKGKKKELSPQDAALMIQMSFRAYLLRRSQTLRGLRELAMAKTKLKDLRALFNNFSYRRRIASDAAEHQRFSEKIIVLLLTVDAIQGADLMVRGAKRSMVDELEAMLDVIDPQPGGVGRCLSMKRRMFDLPSGGIQKDIAAGVAQVVRMLDRDENGTSTSTFEACV